MLLKINLFKVPKESVPDLWVDLEDNGYELEANHSTENCDMVLYLRKKHTETQSWLDYYQSMLNEETFSTYSENLGSETISGAFLIGTDFYAYVVAHGQAHFIIRKHCDKDFGLNLAERIVDPSGLKMKHSQTFTSAGKKDITSYTRKRNLEDSCEYGEAFSYVKCKTIDKKQWGETVDFGESVRFSFGKDLSLTSDELYKLTDRIDAIIQTPATIRLPRYRKVNDRVVLDYLNLKLKQHFMDFLTNVDVDDYWLTGVSFNFSNDYRYSLKIRNSDMIEILDSLDANTVRDVVAANAELVGDRHDLIRVLFYDENDEFVFYKRLKDLMQVTIEYNGKYYVLYHNEWVEFSESYVSFIEGQVDGIQFELKYAGNMNETQLIESLANSGQYTQLHKDNVYVGKYCIEKADLMDDDNIIMIKDQRGQADLVYLIKQATTSLRLSEAGEFNENIFSGRNVCLWMLVERKSLTKLSDFKSFHLLDALNDFKREVLSRNLTPVIWVSLNQK
jgi:uncharacterized protein (TIGR04141 family)